MSKKSLISGIHFLISFSISYWYASNPLPENHLFNLGIDYLEKSKFSVLQGKRVGLLTHPQGKMGWAKVLWMFLSAHLMST